MTVFGLLMSSWYLEHFQNECMCFKFRCPAQPGFFTIGAAESLISVHKVLFNINDIVAKSTQMLL